MKSFTRTAVAIAAALLTTSAAEARTRHHHYRHHAAVAAITVQQCDDNGRCATAIPGLPIPAAPKGYYYDGRMVDGRHAGDPYAFCGAEAVRYVYHVAASAHRDLWLAANWIRKFPRTQAAFGMAAARNHHVMILISQVSGSNWLVHDGNAGGHRTWEHVRSIAGYVIVDPHRSRYASR